MNGGNQGVFISAEKGLNNSMWLQAVLAVRAASRLGRRVRSQIAQGCVMLLLSMLLAH